MNEEQHIISTLEKRLRQANSSVVHSSRDFKEASAEWTRERETLQERIAELESNKTKLLASNLDLLAQSRLHKGLNTRYIELSQFVLFVSQNISPEENILELQPEDFLKRFKEFKNSAIFDNFLVQAAIALGLLK